jgi:hypothetical protein
MMTVERITIEFVQIEVGEFVEELADEDDDAPEFDKEKITQELVNEINEEIKDQPQSYVPECVWNVLAEEDIVPEGLCDRWIKWYEDRHA